MTPRAGVLATVLAVALGALAGCGSSSNTANTSSTSSTVTVTTTSSTTTSTASTTSTSTVATTGTSTTAGPAPCVAADLSVSFLGEQGATGHGLLGFALHNTSSAPCRTYGYPGILFLTSGGAALPTQTTRTEHDFFGSAPKVALVLAPGQSASFRVGVTHVPTGSSSCTTAAGLQVIAPDDTATLHVAIGDGGAYECGTATVSPLRPGRSAYP